MPDNKDSNRFHTVAVIMGGPGSEREVSLRSGAAVAEGLRQAGFEVIERDVQGEGFEVPASVEAVFPLVHGEFGEDGALQARLENMGLPYVGVRSADMMCSFDKERTHELLADAGVDMAEWEMVEPGEAVTLEPPVVLKAPCQGSSIGVEIVHSATELPDALERVRMFGGRVLVEKYVAGSECTVGFMGGEPLPVIRIRPASGAYDYEAKYARGDTVYECPAPLTEEVSQRLQNTASKVFHALKGRDLGRVDFILDENGRDVVLEMNTIPGFTSTSLLPKAAAAAGYGFPELCAFLMNRAT